MKVTKQQLKQIIKEQIQTLKRIEKAFVDEHGPPPWGIKHGGSSDFLVRWENLGNNRYNPIWGHQSKALPLDTVGEAEAMLNDAVKRVEGILVEIDSLNIDRGN